MSAAATSENPGAFSARGALLLVVVGVVLFLALLWMIGTGNGFGDTNDGGGHGGGKGLNGFAGLVRLAEARGWDTALAQDDAALDQPGLLVLTPTADAPGKQIARIVRRHREIGPVLVIAPKWMTGPPLPGTPGARKGWVELDGVRPPQWPGFLDRVRVSLLKTASNQPAAWQAAGLSGQLPKGVVITLTGGGQDDAGNALVPLVELAPLKSGAGAPALLLAAYVAGARAAPSLAALALTAPPASAGQASGEYPLVLVFEPDLLDNYGLADPANVALAERLLAATAGDGPRQITFDLTLDGLGHTSNLLTLAFTPPYLAATLCLIFAALAAGWRSFCRFGTPRAAPLELGFGKRALVANSGALILRARRLHLLGPPYVAAARARIARALALPRHADAAQTDAAIDRALTARQPTDAAPTSGFIDTARRLGEARGEAAIVDAARALHHLERILIR